MKKLLFIIPVLFILATGCQKECDQWHEGTNCKTEIRTKFLGTYRGNNSLLGAISIPVTTYGSVNQLWLDGIYCTLTSSTGSFTVPTQTVTRGGSTLTIYGSGIINTNSLMLTTYVNGTYNYFYGIQ